jgi:hypothetical protein
MLIEKRDIYAIISNAENAPIVILNQESMHQSKGENPNNPYATLT